MGSSQCAGVTGFLGDSGPSQSKTATGLTCWPLLLLRCTKMRSAALLCALFMASLATRPWAPSCFARALLPARNAWVACAAVEEGNQSVGAQRGQVER